MAKPPLTLLLLLGYTLTGEATCFTLTDQRHQLLYEGSRPPFDLSYPPKSVAQSQSEARGEQLAIRHNQNCTERDNRPRLPSPHRSRAEEGGDAEVAQARSRYRVVDGNQFYDPLIEPNSDAAGVSYYTPPPLPTPAPSSNAETIYTGPKGGQYKIVNGKKRYLRKSDRNDSKDRR